MAEIKTANPDHYPTPRDDEEGLTVEKDWTEEEERKAKWKSALSRIYSEQPDTYHVPGLISSSCPS